MTPLFDVVAPRYDRFTRVFSLGMDAGWKREVIALLAERLPTGGTVLDIACGTGDLAFAAARATRAHNVIGVDASTRMLQHAASRIAAEAIERVELRVGDMSHVELPERSVDAVTAGYALRNAPDYRVALRELHRVLKPGGMLLTLDFYRPENTLWRGLFLGYLAVAGSAVGWLWHREPVTYGYIARSIAHHVSWERFAAELEEEGFAVDAVHRKLGGGVAIHVARRLGSGA